MHIHDITSLSTTVLCAGYIQGSGRVHDGIYSEKEIFSALKRFRSENDYFVYVSPSSLTTIMFIKSRKRLYYFCHDTSDMEVILSRKLGAIAKYGAEFYFGIKPSVKKGDILASAPTPNLSSRIYVHVPRERIFTAFLIDRALLYARLFLFIWLTYIIGYIIFSRLLMYPVRRLQAISKKLLSGVWDVDFGEFTTARDEFGDIGRTLQQLSRKELEYRKRAEAIFKIVMRGVSSPEELPDFIELVVNTLRELFLAHQVILIVKDTNSYRINIKAKSGEPVEGEREVMELIESLLGDFPTEGSVIRKTVKGKPAEVFLWNTDSSHKVALGFLLRNELSEEDRNYVRIILRNIVYVLSLIHLATVDLLTNLPNRRSFENDLSKYKSIAVRYARPVSLLLIDIDNFKSINDVYGHQAGDLVLKKVARIMENSVRESDTVYRYGGEEFAVLLPETDKESAKVVAQKILKNIRKESFWIGDSTSLYVTVSVGVASFPEDTVYPEQLVSIADVALYKAKRAGKDRFATVDEREYREIYIKSFQEERELVKSVKEGNIVPYFQPIYDIREGKLYGYEVLSRLVKSTGEVVPAASFITHATRNNLLEEIDRTVYEKARKMFNCKSDVYFFLNASPNSIEKESVMSTLEDIPPELRGRVYIEITEAEAFSDMERALTIIKSLKAMGFKIALDDFGAGFSSMLYLKYLIGNVDLLKVDGHFIRNMAEDRNNRVFLRSIKLISYAFNVPLLGEWVETEKEYKLIKGLGFRFGQGYYFGRPSPECCAQEGSELE